MASDDSMLTSLRSYLTKRERTWDAEEVARKVQKIDTDQKISFYGHEMNTFISLHPDFKIERRSMRYFQSEEPEKSKYLTPEQQAECWVNMENNPINFPNGDILEGEYNFCLTVEQPPRLLCSSSLHHSYLANGKKVLGIGTLSFENGRLFKLSNRSGHYKPTNDEMMQVIKALYTASDQDLKIYTSYSNDNPETFAVLDILKHNNFNELRPLAANEEINIETGKIEVIQVRTSGYTQNFSSSSNQALSLKVDVFNEYQQLMM